jgi:hypothetical protein
LPNEQSADREKAINNWYSMVAIGIIEIQSEKFPVKTLPQWRSLYMAG